MALHKIALIVGLLRQIVEHSDASNLASNKLLV